MKKPRKYFYCVTDKKGNIDCFEDTKKQAKYLADEWNEKYPEEGPHTVEKYQRVD